MIAPLPIPKPLFVPVKVCEARMAPVKVLFDKVCEPVRVTTFEVVAKVTVVPEPVVHISVPPEKVKDALSKSIVCAEPLSGAMSKSCRVVCASTYALMDC